MSEQKIVRMHVTSDRAEELGLLHLNSWQAEPLGSIQEFDGKKYRVIDNTHFNMIVTYEPVNAKDKPTGRTEFRRKFRELVKNIDGVSDLTDDQILTIVNEVLEEFHQ